MSTAPMNPADQAAAAVLCICGTPWNQHQGKDHPFMPRCPYDPSTWKRGARFAHEGLDPASNLYITVEDRLRVNATCGIPGVTLNIVARIQRPDGQVIPMLQQYAMGAVAAQQTFDVDLTEGFLLDVVASTATAGVRRGALFVDADIIRGQGTNAYIARNLIDAYVTTQTNSGWPESDNYEPTAPMGMLRAFNLGNPVAGADFGMQVQVGRRWEVHAINATLQTSATAANRQPVFQITDGAGHVMHNTQFSGTQAASLTYQYSAAEGDPIALNAPFEMGPLPHTCLLFQGWTISSLTANIQAGDQWSAIWALVQEWSEL